MLIYFLPESFINTTLNCEGITHGTLCKKEASPPLPIVFCWTRWNGDSLWSTVCRVSIWFTSGQEHPRTFTRSCWGGCETVALMNSALFRDNALYCSRGVVHFYLIGCQDLFQVMFEVFRSALFKTSPVMCYVFLALFSSERANK